MCELICFEWHSHHFQSVSTNTFRAWTIGFGAVELLHFDQIFLCTPSCHPTARLKCIITCISIVTTSFCKIPSWFEYYFHYTRCLSLIGKATNRHGQLRAFIHCTKIMTTREKNIIWKPMSSRFFFFVATSELLFVVSLNIQRIRVCCIHWMTIVVAAALIRGVSTHFLLFTLVFFPIVW